MSNPIFVNDGDTISVIAHASGPTVSDPADLFPYVTQAYRVVADRSGPTLALVPLGAKPSCVAQGQIDQHFARISNEAVREFEQKWERNKELGRQSNSSMRQAVEVATDKTVDDMIKKWNENEAAGRGPFHE